MRRFLLSVVLLLLAASTSSGQWLQDTIMLPDSLGYLNGTDELVLNPLTGRLYVASGPGLLVVDTATDERLGIYPGYSRPMYCAGADRLCALASGSVLVIDARADTVVARVPVPGFDQASYSATSRRLYLFNAFIEDRKLWAFDVPTAELVDSLGFAGAFLDAVWDSATDRVLFSAWQDFTYGIVVYDCTTNSLVDQLWSDDYIEGHVALEPVLRKLYLSGYGLDTIFVIDPDTLAELARVGAPSVEVPWLVENASHRLLYSAGAATVVYDCRGDSVRTVLDDLPTGALEWDRRTGEVYVARADTTGVAVLDTTDAVSRWLLTDRGGPVAALALLPGGGTLAAAPAQDTLFFVDSRTGVVRHAVVAPYLRVGALVHNPAGNELYALCYNKSVVAVIGPDRQVSHIIEGLPYEHDAQAVLNPVLNRLYVGDDSTLWVVDCNTKQVVSTHELPWYDEPSFLLLADRGQLYIFPRNTDSTAGNVVWMYDCWADSLVPALALPRESPHAVFHPAAGLVYFCVDDDTAPALRALDPNTSRVVRELDIARPDDRNRLAVDTDRVRLYFSSWPDDRLLVLDAVSGAVLDSVDLPLQVDTLVMNHEQDKLYLLRLSRSGSLFRYDCNGDTLLPEIGYEPNNVALLNTRNDKLYFQTDIGLAAIDCRNDSLSEAWIVGRVRYLAWNAIDNLVYASLRGAEIYVFADSPTGVSEEAVVPMLRVGPTVVRGVLMLAGREPAQLLDVTGRHVLNLSPGPNDLRGLAPGIYFLRSAAASQPSAVRKVIVQR